MDVIFLQHLVSPISSSLANEALGGGVTFLHVTND
jgi:hypothetical protein